MIEVEVEADKEENNGGFRDVRLLCHKPRAQINSEAPYLDCYLSNLRYNFPIFGVS